MLWKYNWLILFWCFIFYYPFPVSSIHYRSYYRSCWCIGFVVLWVSRSLASVLHTATYLAIDVCAIDVCAIDVCAIDVCNRCLRSVGPCYLDFNSFMIGRLLSICNFYDHCKPQRSLSSLTYCPIFVRLGALVFDFYDRLWIVEYRYSWSPVMSCWPSVTKYNAVLAETLLARLVFLSPLAPFKRDISLSLSVKICRERIKKSKLPI